MERSNENAPQTKEWVKKRVAKAGSEEAKKYGRPKTKEEKEYLSVHSAKFWLGKERDEETKKKISDAKKEKGFTQKQKEASYKTVYKKSLTGEIICTYESTKQASLAENVNQSTISRWCSANKFVNNNIWSFNK